MATLKNSTNPTASFVFMNHSDDSQRLCLFPGHYNTTEIVMVNEGESKKAVLAYSNPEGIVAAGFQCDQVADDCSVSTTNMYRGEERKYNVEVTPVSKRTRYRDFLNYIKLAGLRVSKIRITDLVQNSAHEIFAQELEVSASAVGAKAGSDFIQLAAYRKPSNYDQSFIEIDLMDTNLLLNETTLAALDIPGKAEIQIDFTLVKA